MKNTYAWWVLILALTACPGFAATYVPPFITPYSYLNEHGEQSNVPTLSSETYWWDSITYWTYDFYSGREKAWIQPDYEGEYLETWEHTVWANPTYPATDGTTWWETWYGEAYYSGEFEDLPANLSFAYEYAETVNTYPISVYGDPGTLATWQHIVTEVIFWSGGVPGVAATNFFRIAASAVDQLGTAPIPKTSLMVAGNTCDNNGYVYTLAADNDWYDATVHAEQAGYSNYTFNVEVYKAKLILSRAGVGDVTGQTNTVIVGEQIALTCQFVNMDGESTTIAPITNFQWTVPGSTVSNYIWDATPSVLHSNLNLTNASTYFYWYRPASNLTVQCSIVAKGVTMTAKTTFNVLAPTYTWTACPSNTISMDANYFAEGTWLHFGSLFPSNGMTFRAEPISLVQSNFGMDVCQIFAFSEAKRWSNGVRRITVSTNSLDWLEGGTGAEMDSYKVLRWGDSPGERGFPTEQGITRTDSFLSYLLYRSEAANSIPVPLSVVSWSWSGSATNNGGWSLTSSPSSFSPTNCLQGSSWPEFPMWKTLWPDDVLIWNAF